MRNRTTTTVRACAGALGGLLLTGVATAAAADDTPDSDAIDVIVEIAELDEPGVLAMTVAGDATTLTENGSTPTVRQFTGTLPTVTITDTRTPDEIPDGAFWYVLGDSTAFSGATGQAPIGAEYLGWAPRLLDGGALGLVSAGDPVGTVLDPAPHNVGLVDQELFALAADSDAVAGEGQWTATADLTLRTPATVQPGVYLSTVTLSLFE